MKRLYMADIRRFTCHRRIQLYAGLIRLNTRILQRKFPAMENAFSTKITLVSLLYN